ncbi:hypothetical protein [Hymenobacter sp. B81]|uniref:hypothetical protein n=1 Tax=Hymenobacter sp. B81 TaxID=3344878 RepID=UPI0037DC1305
MLLPLLLFRPLLAALLWLPQPTALPMPAASPDQASRPANFWRPVSAAARARLGAPRFAAAGSRVLALDLPALRRYLARTPAQGAHPTPLVLPLPDGRQPAFRVQLSSVMAPELAARFPELRAYTGQAAALPATDARFEVTPAGLRAQLIVGGQVFLIEPYRAGDTRHYLCFAKAALPPGSKQWSEPPMGEK